MLKRRRLRDKRGGTCEWDISAAIMADVDYDRDDMLFQPRSDVEPRKYTESERIQRFSNSKPW